MRANQTKIVDKTRFINYINNLYKLNGEVIEAFIETFH